MDPVGSSVSSHCSLHEPRAIDAYITTILPIVVRKLYRKLSTNLVITMTNVEGVGRMNRKGKDVEEDGLP